MSGRSAIGLLLASLGLFGEGAAAQLVRLSEFSPSIVQEMRYFSENNFIGTRIEGYLEAECMVTREAARALDAAQEDALRYGLSLKVYDCYRPQRGVDHFIRWGRDLADQVMKAAYYPAIDKSRLFELGFIASRSGHSRGSTVDITLIPASASGWRPDPSVSFIADCRAPLADRYPDNSIDMGTGYDCFDDLAHTANHNIPEQARANRLLLKLLLERHGFRNYSKEWWHFTLNGEPFPDTYFDIPISEGRP